MNVDEWLSNRLNGKMNGKMNRKKQCMRREKREERKINTYIIIAFNKNEIALIETCSRVHKMTDGKKEKWITQTQTQICSATVAASTTELIASEKRRWNEMSNEEMWRQFDAIVHKNCQRARETLAKAYKINNRLHLKYKCVFISYFYYII